MKRAQQDTPADTVTNVPEQSSHDELMVSLTADVRRFSDALTRLKHVIESHDGVAEVQPSMHALSGVLAILRAVLEKYSHLRHTDVLHAAAALIHKVKELRTCIDAAAQNSEVIEAIEQLAIAFSSCISEYLMGDLPDSAQPAISSRARSFEELTTSGRDDQVISPASDSANTNDLTQLVTEGSSDEAVLFGMEQGVDLALQKAKLWTKYARDIGTYIEKRCQHESDCAKNLAKLSNVMKATLTEHDYLPMQSTFCIALEHDLEQSKNSLAASTALTGDIFLNPLHLLITEQEKNRKAIKQRWQRDCKKLQDSRNNLKKARLLYMQRQQEFERAKDALQRAEENSTKFDRKRKTGDEAMHRAAEAETTYKACVHDANEQEQLTMKAKLTTLTALSRLMKLGDSQLQTLAAKAFQLLHKLAAPTAIQFQTLCERIRLYVPGSQYTEYTRNLQTSDSNSKPVEHVFEPYLSEHSYRAPLDNPISAQVLRQTSSHGSDAEDLRERHKTGLSDSESGSMRSLDSSPANSPSTNRRRAEYLEVRRSPSAHESMSAAARTHNFRHVTVTSAKCIQCEKNVSFNTLQCTQCGVSCHKRCVELLTSSCLQAPPTRRTSHMFGVGLREQMRAGINPLVVKCVQEIDARGMDIKGIYRVSGVKSKVESLCDALDGGKVKVDLSSQHPNVIANVIKLYFRQLPEPVATFERYDDFVRLAREDMETQSESGREDVVVQLRSLCNALPPENRSVLAYFMRHLKRITENSEQNQMTAVNLGIVLGPTLIRAKTAEGHASFNTLVDTPYLTRAVELLITYAEEVLHDNSARSSVQSSSSDDVTNQSASTEAAERASERGGGPNDTCTPNTAPEQAVPPTDGTDASINGALVTADWMSLTSGHRSGSDRSLHRSDAVDQGGTEDKPTTQPSHWPDATAGGNSSAVANPTEPDTDAGTKPNDLDRHDLHSMIHLDFDASKELMKSGSPRSTQLRHPLLGGIAEKHASHLAGDKHTSHSAVDKHLEGDVPRVRVGSAGSRGMARPRGELHSPRGTRTTESSVPHMRADLHSPLGSQQLTLHQDDNGREPEYV